MKKFLTLLFWGLLSSGLLIAQQHLFLEEQELTLADGKVSAWVFPAGGSQEETLNDMKDFLKDRSDIKLKKQGDDMLMAEKVSLPAITTKRGDLIGICRITQQYYSMAVIVRLGYDISLSSSEWPTEMASFHHYVKNFMIYHYEQVYARRIGLLEDQVKDVEKTRNQDEKEIGNINNKISSNNKKIAKETDNGKINALNAENTTLEADLKVLTDNLPALVTELDNLNTKIEENKAELNIYLSKIATF